MRMPPAQTSLPCLQIDAKFIALRRLISLRQLLHAPAGWERFLHKMPQSGNTFPLVLIASLTAFLNRITLFYTVT